MKEQEEISYVKTGEALIEEAKLETLYGQFGTRIEVPKTYLWGRQEPKAYTRTPEYQVKKALTQMGSGFLQEHPILTVIVPHEERESRLVVVDGHHRTRFAPAFGVNKIPGIVTDIENLADWTSANPAEMAQKLDSEATQAINLFRYKSRDRIILDPHVLPLGIRSQELADYFCQTEQVPFMPIIMQPTTEYVIHQRR